MTEVPSASPPRPLERFVDLLIRRRVALFVAAIALSALAYPVSLRLRFDQSIESLYADDDPQLLAYRRSKASFGGDEFVFVAWFEPELFEDDGVTLQRDASERILALSRELTVVPGVNPASTQDLARAMAFPYRQQGVRKLVEGVLVGSDGETTSVGLRLLPQQPESPIPRAETIARIRAIAAAQERPTFVVGEPVQVQDMFRYVEEDGQTLFRFSVALLAGVIVLYFRSVRWVLLPLLVVAATILWTEAILVLSRMKLSMVSSMLNSLATIVAVATVTHVTVHYRERRRTQARIDAARRTLIDLLPAVFWTSATTVLGFGALVSSEITPVRSFGVMMALATTMVQVAVILILPGGMLIGDFDADPGDAPAEAKLGALLARITGSVERHPRALTAGTLILTLVAAAGLWRLRIETDFSKNFRASSPIVQSLEFVETRLGGAGTWETNFDVPRDPGGETASLTPEFLERVRKLTAELGELAERRPQLTKVTGLTDGLDLVPEKVALFPVPLETRLSTIARLQPEFVSSLYDRERGRMRIVLRAVERQPAETKHALIDDATAIARREFPEAQASGLFVLLTHLIESLMRDQLTSFLIATVGIWLMMWIAYRSAAIGLASLVPNLFPIVLVIGAMGWIGLPINIATAMIASVSMGLTVDSSIHYLSGYRRSRLRGLSATAAMHETHQGVGRSLVLANVALIVGFSVLTASHFIPLVYFGVLVSVAIFGGLIGNLVLLPLLLQWIASREESGKRKAESG